MNLPQVFDWRNKRNINPIIQNMNYSTYSLPDFTENKNMRGGMYDLYDPHVKSFSEISTDKKIDDKNERSEPWLIKSALQVCTMIFRKIAGRASSPDLSYHDCDSPSQEAPTSRWQSAKTENKNIEAHTAGFAYTDCSEMSGDYKSVVASCESKLNTVRQLITSKPAPSSPKCTTYKSRRRRRVFVESSSVEDSFEDAFCPEDFISESNSDALAFIIPYQYQDGEFLEIDAPKMKIETPKMKIQTPKTEMEASSIDIKTQAPEQKEDLIINTDIVKTEVVEHLNPNIKPEIIKTEVVEHLKPAVTESKTNFETISACESKIMQLQAMLRRRCSKNTKTMLNSSDSVPEPVKDLPNEKTKQKVITTLVKDLSEQTKPKVIPPPVKVLPSEQKKPKVNPAPKVQDKRFKNRHRLSTGKRKKADTKKLIHDDMIFADEIAETPSSYENSTIVPSLSSDRSSSSLSLDKSVESLGVTPTEDCFDEVAGRFRTASGTESDDSFQVVFTDSPRAMRPSDCESEDSFIFFEDSPDSCYTSNDVFGDESESEYSDTDSEISDSGCGDSDELKISHNMTKTFEDLTDDRLYEENKDVVDSAVKMCVEIPNDELDLDSVSDVRSTGLLLDDAKKQMRRNQQAKKVHFSEKPPKVHVMRVWAFAARQARAGHWERHALDRERFKRRIADADMALSWVLKPQHRSRVMFQRFMPWWNAQKRKELAEKKEREAEEKKLLEEEKIKEEQRTEEEKRITEENERIEEVNGVGEVINKDETGKCTIGEVNTKVDGESAKVPNITDDTKREKVYKVEKQNSEVKRQINKSTVTVTKNHNIEDKKIKENNKSTEKHQKNIQGKQLDVKNITTGIQKKNGMLQSNENDKQNHKSNNEIMKNSATVLDNERTNLNVTNQLNSVSSNKNKSDLNKVNMKIILKEDKCLIPLTAEANEAVS